ncbi:pyrimidine dimer DNA glycosylase/endonuclease V [Tessaracoccus terricola]
MLAPMRLWSLHPALLDRAALVACWREGLLAQAVLAGRTRGYRNHPQLERFRASPDPLVAVATYLSAVAEEADARGYRFDRTRLDADPAAMLRMAVTRGQLELELEHLRAKVLARAPEWLGRLGSADPHPVFHVVPGPPESWERHRS